MNDKVSADLQETTTCCLSKISEERDVQINRQTADS